MPSIKEKLEQATQEQREAAWDRLKEFTFDSIRSFGKMATEEHAEARVNVCRTLNNGKPCEYFGTVQPLPIEAFKVPGCTKCGCPFETKARMIVFGFNQVKCPHPFGNKWSAVDSNFKK